MAEINPEGDEDYECSLDEASIGRAQVVLRENPSDRMGAVRKFQELIRERKWIRTPMNPQFLLQFLRARKFSLLEAMNNLERYWMLRTEIPEWYSNLDPADPVFKEIFDMGLYIPLPLHDSEGRKIFLCRMAAYDPGKTKFTAEQFLRANALIVDHLLYDERTQVNSFLGLVDGTGFTMKHQMFWGLDNLVKLSEGWTKSYPLRFVGVIHYNVGPVFNAFFQLMKHAIPEKLQKKIFLYGKSLVPVYEKIPMHLLPDEYLPDDYDGPRIGPVKKVLDDYYNHLMEPATRKFFQELSSDKYGIDRNLKPKISIEQSSFRYTNKS